MSDNVHIMAVDTHELHELLSHVLSPNPSIRIPCESRIAELQKQPNFLTSLLSIIISHISSPSTPNTDNNTIPFLASVIFKNSILSLWMLTIELDSQSLSNQERDLVKSLLLDTLISTQFTTLSYNNPITKQIALAIANIARFEYPKRWMNLIPQLTSTPGIHALSTLYAVVKELSRRNLTRDRNQFGNIIGNCFVHVFSEWNSHFHSINTQTLHSFDENSEIYCRFILLFKCIRILLSFSILDSAPFSSSVNEFLAILNSPTFVNTKSEKISTLSAKCWISVQSAHSLTFLNFYSIAFHRYATYLINYCHSISNLNEKLSILSANYIRNVIQTEIYLSESLEENIDYDMKDSVQLIKNVVFGADGWELSRNLIEKVFVLSLEEIQSWDEDPEEHFREEEAIDWSTDQYLRPICESIFISLFTYNNAFIGTQLIQSVQKCAAQCNSAWNNAVLIHSVDQDRVFLEYCLQYDACLRAVGKVAYEMERSVEFGSWFDTEFIRLMQLQCINNSEISALPLGLRILKARAAWLAAQYVGQTTRNTRLCIYSALSSLLSPNSPAAAASVTPTQLSTVVIRGDLMIRLGCARALHVLIEDVDFIGTDFVEYFSVTLNGIFSLIHELRKADSKQQLMYMLSALIERSPSYCVLPNLDVISSQLVIFWNASENGDVAGGAQQQIHGDGNINHELYEIADGFEDEQFEEDEESGGETLIKVAVVVLLRRTMDALGADAAIHAGIASISASAIRYSIEQDALGTAVYLIEDGLELWLSLIRASPTYSIEIRDLFPLLITFVLSRSFDHLRVSLLIIESYALLGTIVFLTEFIQIVGSCFQSIVGNVRDRGHLALCECLDTIIQLISVNNKNHEHDYILVLHPIFVNFMTIVKNERETDVLRASIMSILCRIACNFPSVFDSLLVSSDSHDISKALELMIDLCDAMYLTSRRKLAVLAMCSSVIRYQNVDVVIEKNLISILKVAVQVISEIDEEETSRASIEKEFGSGNEKVIGSVSALEYEDQTDHENERCLQSPDIVRRQILNDNDSVLRMNLKSAIKEMLQSLQNSQNGVVSNVINSIQDPLRTQIQSLIK